MNVRSTSTSSTPNLEIHASQRYRSLRALVPASIAVAAVSLVAWYPVQRFALGRADVSLADGVSASAIGLVAAALAFTIWRIVLAARYQPVPLPAEKHLPMLTVVVPAFNEGRQVLDTLVCLSRSDYPADRLQIIAVDDGSQDDTWAWMLRAKRELGSVIEIVRQPENRGKRHALAAGFARARGQIVVTIDSDSEVNPDTLQHMVAPFVADPCVGAVAGNIRVMARQEGTIARILDASFTYSFELIRAGQSVLGAVLCTPGAAAAYRADLVRTVLEEWRDQTFMGRPANIGEDRALTNLILRAGFNVVFQVDAIVETKVPSNYRALSRMLLRWGRSNVRESLALLTFAFQPLRPTGMLGLRLLALQGAFAILLSMFGTAGLVVALFTSPLATMIALFVGTMLTAIVPGLGCRILRGPGVAPWMLMYGFWSTFALSWISPWAVLTPHNGNWMTRALNSGTTPLPLPVPARQRAQLASFAEM
ncbi:glycosyltransferase family 2 protein [Chondromyces crocatus]|uniref:Glycosyl transferase family 2 n=1 Tax=Chondromyces crocatus TaxID=52 RepID=A0A0K1EAX1_CHOCO|nr:glycosyltransferase [Chondromyces crocatus]AKT37999.1 glycosyl transferase family 2 [Chondromyces crocatus]